MLIGYCPQCRQNICSFAFEVFEMICEHYIIANEPFRYAENNPYFTFGPIIQYLEERRYVITSDHGSYDDIIIVKPIGEIYIENNLQIFCTCTHVSK